MLALKNLFLNGGAGDTVDFKDDIVIKIYYRCA